MIDAKTRAAICARAKELADAAPPFTTEQAHLLTSVFGRYSDSDGSIDAVAGGA
jgi:hypothetical protein